MALTLFRSSLHDEFGLLVLLQLRFPVLLQLRILCCLLLPFVGILHDGHAQQFLLLCHKDDAWGKLL